MDWFLGEICSSLAVLAVPVNGKIDWIMMSIFMIIISESNKPNVRFKFVEPSNHDCGSQLGVYLFAMLKSTWAAIPINPIPRIPGIKVRQAANIGEFGCGHRTSMTPVGESFLQCFPPITMTMNDQKF
jgi:hypothetical protein